MAKQFFFKQFSLAYEQFQYEKYFSYKQFDLS